MIKIFEYMSTMIPFSINEDKYINIKVMTNKYYLTNVFILSTIRQFQIVLYFQMKRFNVSSYLILK